MIKPIQLKIDPEFQSLIPPLTDEEFKQLRENIIEDCEVREPIVTWNGIILDGHNRWAIIQENPDIPYKTMEMIFASRNEAKAWMIRNQLGRRNLPNYERARLALQLKPLLAEEAKKRQQESGGDRRSEEYRESVSQKSVEPIEQKKPIDVQKELARAAGVSHDTIAKVEKIEAKAAPEVKEQLRKGEVSINKAYQEIRKAEREDEPQPPKPSAPTYTIDNLISEVNASAENYLRFLKQTLVSRSTVYADADDKKRVYEVIFNLKQEIEKIENLLK